MWCCLDEYVTSHCLKLLVPVIQQHSKSLLASSICNAFQSDAAERNTIDWVTEHLEDLTFRNCVCMPRQYFTDMHSNTYESIRQREKQTSNMFEWCLVNLLPLSDQAKRCLQVTYQCSAGCSVEVLAARAVLLCQNRVTVSSVCGTDLWRKWSWI